jgi:prepilin-type N-terminal cleavage/methylation domain-containing protein
MKKMSSRYLKTNDRLSVNLKAPSPLMGEGKRGGACKFPPPLHPLPPAIRRAHGPEENRGREGRVIVGRPHEEVLPAASVAGFTLIEVLVAVVILVFGLLAVGSMQIAAIRGNFMGGNTSIALSLASEKMEDLLNKDFNHADLDDSVTGNNGTLSSTTSVDHQENLSEEGVVGASGFYRRIWNISDQASPITKNMMVIVTWENNKHRISIASIKRP